jgi:ActR/RegA family two-component response regulator
VALEHKDDLQIQPLTMFNPIDIFKVDETGNLLWVIAVENLETAKAHIEALSAHAPGQYVIFDQRSRNKIPLETAKQKHVRVLFLDDDERTRMTMREALERSGFEVFTAGTLADALAEIKKTEFDVLISDLRIHEGVDGFIALDAMRHVQPRCVNIILTGYPEVANAVHALRTQVDDYFIKPVEMDELVQKMKQHLDKRSPIIN